MQKFNATLEYDERTGEFTTYAHEYSNTLATDKDLASAIRRTCMAVESEASPKKSRIIPMPKNQ